MKFALSILVVGIFFIIARYVADAYFPEHEFLVGWLTGTFALVAVRAFE